MDKLRLKDGNTILVKDYHEIVRSSQIRTKGLDFIPEIIQEDRKKYITWLLENWTEPK